MAILTLSVNVNCRRYTHESPARYSQVFWRNNELPGAMGWTSLPAWLSSENSRARKRETTRYNTKAKHGRRMHRDRYFTWTSCKLSMLKLETLTDGPETRKPVLSMHSHHFSGRMLTSPVKACARSGRGRELCCLEHTTQSCVPVYQVAPDFVALQQLHVAWKAGEHTLHCLCIFVCLS